MIRHNIWDLSEANSDIVDVVLDSAFTVPHPYLAQPVLQLPLTQPVFQLPLTQVEPRSEHECMVCGDTISLSAQVCSRYCMRALEQMEAMDLMDKIEAQVGTLNSSTTSDYEAPSYQQQYQYQHQCPYPHNRQYQHRQHQIVPEHRIDPYLAE